MPNQRSQSKTRVTVPMEKTLERALQEVARFYETDRVEIINKACEAYVSEHRSLLNRKQERKSK